MTAPKISVIIPVFNTEKYVARAIESVLSQTLKPAEIIVVDDGSTDNSIEAVRRFLPKVKIITQQNKGAGAARNTGIKQASTEYLAFLDADDLWAPQKLHIQTEFHKKNPEIEMVFGTVQQFISPELNEQHQNMLREELKTMPGFVPGTLLIKKETFFRVGLFNENLVLGEFVDWFSRAKDLGFNYAIIDDIVLKRRIHTTNTGLLKKNHVTEYTRVLRHLLKNKRDGN
jgi:glycosyltransferase involved in cell wall biosynthesis